MEFPAGRVLSAIDVFFPDSSKKSVISGEVLGAEVKAYAEEPKFLLAFCRIILGVLLLPLFLFSYAGLFILSNLFDMLALVFWSLRQAIQELTSSTKVPTASEELRSKFSPTSKSPFEYTPRLLHSGTATSGEATWTHIPQMELRGAAVSENAGREQSRVDSDIPASTPGKESHVDPRLRELTHPTRFFKDRAQAVRTLAKEDKKNRDQQSLEKQGAGQDQRTVSVGERKAGRTAPKAPLFTSMGAQFSKLTGKYKRKSPPATDGPQTTGPSPV